MNLLVQRDTYTSQSTTGELVIGNAHFCFTLEPRKDQSAGKPYCIPAGVYPVLLEYSYRFNMQTPHLQNVPGFTEVEIHPGNFSDDTEACLLVGESRSTDAVWSSRTTFERLMSVLAQTQDDITIEYIG